MESSNRQGDMPEARNGDAQVNYVHFGGRGMSSDHEGREEVCAGCGVRGFAHAPLRWKIEGYRGFPDDHYCEACYWEFRKTEFAEEAVIRAIKNAGLDQMFSLKELQRAMDGVCGLEPHAFVEAIERGNNNIIESRSDEDLQSVYGPLAAKGRAVHGKAQAAWDAKGGHAA
jgi:hypothetical protein